jgi:hypothetical protein
MSLESINGKRKFRISPDDNHIVQIQRGHGARWQDYRTADSWVEASKLVMELGRTARDETQELPAVKE